MSAALRRLGDLEPVETVKGWTDVRRKHDYIMNVMKYQKYCRRSLFKSVKKVRDWCTFLEDYKPPSSWPPTTQITHLTTPSTSFNQDIDVAFKNMTRSRIEIPNDTSGFLKPSTSPFMQNRTMGGAMKRPVPGFGSPSRNGCYDDFNCDTPDLAYLNHYLMGVFALALCVIGVLANTLCVPSFNIHANRSSATFYMTAIAVCDTLVLILSTLVIVMKNVPADYASQQTVYKTFSGYLIPSAMPALELCELMSFWIVIALLIDRFFYLRNGFQSKAVCSRSLCAKVILVIFGCLMLYTAPKYLQYKIVEYEITAPVSASASASSPASGSASADAGSARVTQPTVEVRHEVKVMLTQISSSDGYRNVMTHWLKVPVEMFIPMLILTGFTGYFLFKVVENKGAWYAQIKRNRQTPPAISNPLRTIVTERQVRQENVNILIALGVGLLVFACKMPKFVAHVLVTETGHLSPAFQVTVRFLDLLCAALKPALYLGVGDHLHRGIFGMFWSSCRAHEESAHEEIARVHMEMNNVNMTVAMAAVAASNSSPVGGSPVTVNPEECQPLNPNGDTGAGAVGGEHEDAPRDTADGDLESVTITCGNQQETKEINMTTSC